MAYFKSPHNSKKIYIDDKLKDQLDCAILDLKDNDDFLCCVVGKEGAGKSKLVRQIGAYFSNRLSNSFNEDNIHFDSQYYMDASLKAGVVAGVIDKELASYIKKDKNDNILNLKKNEAKCFINILDESRRSLSKMKQTGNKLQTYLDFMAECRSMNQIHIPLLPRFCDLTQDVAVHRTKLIIEVLKGRNQDNGKLIRGYYNVYSTNNKKLVEFAWKDRYTFPRSLYMFTGRFNNVEALDEAKYEKKKNLHRLNTYMSSSDDKKEELSVEEDPKYLKLLDYFKKLYRTYKDNYGGMDKDLDIQERTFRRFKKKIGV